MDNNWTISQTKELFELAFEAYKQGKGLSYAFEQMAVKGERSLNSVRNYYYSQLKMFSIVPGLAADLGIKLIPGRRANFTTFKQDEIKGLIEYILTSKAKGVSVRAAIAELSKGDTKMALRLQNKYRSMLNHHSKTVNMIMEDMAKRGIQFYNPYKKSVVDKNTSSDNIKLLTEYISRLDEAEAGSFLTLIKKLI